MIKTICIALILISGLHAQYEQSRLDFKDIMIEGSKILQVMENINHEIVKVDIDLVSMKNSKQTLKYMSSKFTYIITAVGQTNKIKDLDIQVHFIQPSGDPYIVKKDIEADNIPTVRFRPYTSGVYMINISAASMIDGYENLSAFYFLAICHN
jgi:hypothetical protein